MDKETIEKAVEVLKNGGIILYPTDTIWGIGCDATNEVACKKISDLKKRTDDKSFIVLTDSWRMTENYVPDFPEICYDLVDLAVRPLTIVYPTSRNLAPSVLSTDNSVAIRMTNDSLCQALIRGLKKPIVSTSANISGENFPRKFTDISPLIIDGVDFSFFDHKNKVHDEPSQIIKISIKGSIEIIRE